MPVEVTTLRTPNQVTLQAWVDAGNTFPMFSHATLQVESNGTDSNGSLLETNSSIRVLYGGYGYADPATGFFPIYTAPSIVISGGGGMGAQASATMGERFIVPIGSSLVSIGIINPDLVDANGEASFTMEQNSTLAPGTVTVDANVTNDLISIDYNASTVTDLINALNALPLVFNQAPEIVRNATSIQGSVTQPLVELNATSFNAISMVTVTEGGRGYRNLDPNNIPTARLDFNASGQEKNATLEVRLGGSVANIPGCTTCDIFIRGNGLTDFHEHTGAWIEFGTREGMKEAFRKEH